MMKKVNISETTIKTILETMNSEMNAKVMTIWVDKQVPLSGNMALNADYSVKDWSDVRDLIDDGNNVDLRLCVVITVEGHPEIRVKLDLNDPANISVNY